MSVDEDVNRKIRDLRKKICDRENIRIFKFLKNTDILAIATEPFPNSEEEVRDRIDDIDTISNFWSEFLQELSEILGTEIQSDNSATLNYNLLDDELTQIEDEISISSEGTPEFIDNDEGNLDKESFDITYDDVTVDEYIFEPIEQIYDGDIDKDTWKSRYLDVSSSIFFVKIWWRLYKEKNFFSEISSKYPLTKQQKVAVLSNEKRNLVVAGAGTGKTHLMIAKANYLLQKQKLNENDILLLAFNNDAAAQLRDRGRESIGIRLNAFTFHAYGKNLSKDLELSLNPDEEDRDIKKPKWIQELLDSLPTSHPITKKIIYYFSEYLIPPPSPKMDYKSINEYQNYIKNIQKRALSGDKVKSYGELLIANFLSVHGVTFEYEAKFKSQNITYTYRPDFTVFKDGRRDQPIIIEFFGIDKDGNVKPGILPQRYKNLTHKKIELHNNEGSDFISLYYYQQQEGSLLKNLQKELLKRGVKLERLPDEILLEKFNQSQYFTLFAQLSSDFLSQYKSNQHNIKDLILKADGDKRTLAFLEIFEWIKDNYTKYLDENNLRDFSDMINDGTKALLEKNVKTSWKWIIVDEFQDISAGRLRLIKALLQQNPEAKLMVVGDDWQAIYRFAGSDINLVTKFEKYFGKSVEFKLTKSFRFNSQIKELSQKFIQQNPIQKKKSISVDKKEDPFKNWIHWSAQGLTPEKRSQKILEVVKKMKSELKLNGDLLILARYNHNLPKGPELSQISNVWGENFKFMTVHRAKGQEADYVLLVDLISGVYGFPAVQSDDPILNLVLASSGPEDLLMHGEERRLFYVAMTRAKEEVHIITDVPNPSIFVDEVLSYGT